MKPPPNQVAATVEVLVKRSSTAMTLVPAVPGLPWLAYHEIVVWGTSSGPKFPPLIPQRVRGVLALETSARTGVDEPWSWRTASWAAGVPTQLPCRAAQAGTTTGLGSTVGDGVGLGLASGLGVGLGVGDGVVFLACGVEGGASGPFGVQPAIAATARRRTTPFLTARCNEPRYGSVTRVPSWCKSPRIPLAV